MEIGLRGWRRDHGKKKLVEEEALANAQGPDERDGNLFYSGSIYLDKEANGDVRITTSASDVKLNGDYMVVLRLSVDDVVTLAKLAFREKSFGEIVDALSVTRRKKPKR